MPSPSRFVFPAVLAGVILIGGTAMTAQERQSIALRVALERAKADAGELARLTEANRRLRARQIPTAELERLRADHATLPRLRAELQALERTQHSRTP